MALNVPKNKIKEKYTSGGEFIVESTNAPYQGYYYELNNALYAGKTFNAVAPKLVPIKDRNTLYNKGKSTAIYSAITGITSKQIQPPNITSIPVSNISMEKNIDLKFYCRKINQQSIIIKEISEDDYKSLQNNPLYQTTYTGFYNNKSQNTDDAEKQLPGVKAFLGF